MWTFAAPAALTFLAACEIEPRDLSKETKRAPVFHAAGYFQNAAATLELRVVMNQLTNGVGLIPKPLSFALRVAVYVCRGFCPLLIHRVALCAGTSQRVPF
jgi:hypothetical protein